MENNAKLQIDYLEDQVTKLYHKVKAQNEIIRLVKILTSNSDLAEHPVIKKQLEHLDEQIQLVN